MRGRTQSVGALARLAAVHRYATEAERDAENVLRGLGFVTRKVQQTTSSTPDFEVDGDRPAYLVEVKSRDWPREILDPPEQLAASVERSMTYDKEVGDWLHKSRKQFGAIDPNHRRLWFVWCSMESGAPVEQAERVVRTLYGVRDAYDAIDPTRQWRVFYSQRTAFERFRDVDGAVIIAPPDGMTFCPNEFSARIDAVLSSKLVASFRDLGVHPMPPIAPGNFVVPRTLDRSDERALLRHCQGALGAPYLQFWAMDIERISAAKAQRR